MELGSISKRVIYVGLIGALGCQSAFAAGAPSPSSSAAATANPNQSERELRYCKPIVPIWPSVNWSGSVTYLARFTVANGQVVDIRIEPQTQAPPRRVNKELVTVLEQAIRSAEQCPGDHSYAHTFTMHSD